MPNIVAIIPARSGSKGVPNKNLRLLGGNSLLAWSIRACLKSRHISRVIVSTDSFEYADHAKNLGAEAPFLRPPEISTDTSTDYEFITHALDWFSIHSQEPDYLVHVRPTTPLRDPRIIDLAIDTFLSSPEATALRSVHQMSESAYKSFVVTPAGQLKGINSNDTSIDAYNTARQQFPPTYQANGYVDVLSTSFIRRNALLHGNRVIPFITRTAIEVDTEDDFSYLEYQLTSQPSYLSLFAD